MSTAMLSRQPTRITYANRGQEPPQVPIVKSRYDPSDHEIRRAVAILSVDQGPEIDSEALRQIARANYAAETTGRYTQLVRGKIVGHDRPEFELPEPIGHVRNFRTDSEGKKLLVDLYVRRERRDALDDAGLIEAGLTGKPGTPGVRVAAVGLAPKPPRRMVTGRTPNGELVCYAADSVGPTLIFTREAGAFDQRDLIDFATSRGITDLDEARRAYASARLKNHA
jgi:hypothetical protein